MRPLIAALSGALLILFSSRLAFQFELARWQLVRLDLALAFLLLVSLAGAMRSFRVPPADDRAWLLLLPLCMISLVIGQYPGIIFSSLFDDVGLVAALSILAGIVLRSAFAAWLVASCAILAAAYQVAVPPLIARILFAG